MIDALLRFSIERRWIVMFLVSLVAALGIYNYQRLPIDAVPDITNVQVQINTLAEGYSPLEVEQRVTVPIETTLAGLPQLEYTRSLSRYGLSQITVVFAAGTDLYFARTLINERLQQAQSQLPPGIAAELGPVATGLGEIFLYSVQAGTDASQPYHSAYDATALRTLQDWVIRPQLRAVPGVTEVNTIGGYEKQYHVTPDPGRLLALGISMADVVQALRKNNATVGAGYLERNGEQYLVRVPGQLDVLEDIQRVVVAERDGVPVTVNDLAGVALGKQLRTGAASRDGEEIVLGTAVMLVGENSRTVAQAVAAKLAEINKTLPAGVSAEPVYNRTQLVDKTIATVQTNLLEGAVLVVVLLLCMLGNVRAALLTAAVIPLSVLLLITGMVENHVSANLMSLGALDFGLIVDGAVIIVENCVLRLGQRQQEAGRRLDARTRFEVVFTATREVFTPSLISVLVVILVNLPILALTGVEGKMFRPMAVTVIVALLGALLLSLTFVPAAAALLLNGEISERESRAMAWAKSAYAPILRFALARHAVIVTAAVMLFAGAIMLATKLGAEFIPNLDEGDVAVQALRIPGTSLTQSLDMQMKLEKALLALPEVRTVFARTGTAEVATDPMPPNISDGYVMLRPRSDWPDSRKTKAQLLQEIEHVLRQQRGNAYEVSQPIQLRFNELISGIRSDVGIKVYGDDPQQLLAVGNRLAGIVNRIHGADGVKVEQADGLPMLSIEVNRAALSRHGISIAELQELLATAIGGTAAGTVFEGDRRFAIIVRLAETQRADLAALQRLPVPLPHGGFLPLSEVAQLLLASGPNQISRENGKRRLVVSSNVRNRDLASFVAEAQRIIAAELQLPAGYWLEYGGTFQQLESATRRLQLLVPLTLLLIFGLLLVTFGSAKDALLVFSGVPLALTGGVVALWLRDIPLSISAGVGFITLSGVAVLTGVVMVSAFRDMSAHGRSLAEIVTAGAMLRLRPVLMVGLVASLGFLPMALNTGTGAEVQRPLATVVIGGVVSATLLTLLVLPAMYAWAHRGNRAIL